MAVWTKIRSENNFYLLRSTLRRSLETNTSLSGEVRKAYEEILEDLEHATKDEEIALRGPQVEIPREDPKPKKTRAPRAQRGSVVKIEHCSTHKTYGGKRVPRSDCDTCWEVYAKFNGADHAKRQRAKQQRSSS